MPGEVVELAVATNTESAKSASAVEGSEYVGERPVIEKRTGFYQIVTLGEDSMVDMMFSGMRSSSFRNCVTEHLRDKIGYHQTNGFKHKYPLDLLARHYTAIKNSFFTDYSDDDNGEMQYLFAKLEKRSEILSAEIKKRLATGRIEFNDITLIFEKEDIIVANMDDEDVAGVVQSIEIEQMMMGIVGVVTIEVISLMRGGPSEAQYKINIAPWDGMLEISSLPVRKIDEKTKAELTERGRKFLNFAKPGSYLHYTGTLVQPGWWSRAEYKADGRIIVDPFNMQRVEPDTFRNCLNGSGLSEEGDKNTIEIDEANLYRVWPVTAGFSFVSKKWGLLRLSNMRPIVWNDDAYEKLVMNEQRKDVIRALVEGHDDSFSDIIDGKGGGCIFLLHGPPGQGKTLTAEAIAELLHRPLYSISIGELGVDPDGLEKSLRKVLDIATVWNAVLLLDEADIFLEERNESDIVRNAMVGVFLRLLEYHQGVMFLTTNRVKNIDNAFYSRITLSLKFDEADRDKRFKIWQNLLSSAKIDLPNEEVMDLSAIPMNGRQIKNNIRTAITLSRYRKRAISLKLLLEIIELTGAFHREMTK